MTTVQPLRPLRGATFERKPKRVHILSTYKDYTGKVGQDPYKTDLLKLRSQIIQGHELDPVFYRTGFDKGPDALLATLGIKHLHLGGRGSDVILYVVEYEDYVVFLEVNGHNRLGDVPVGHLLHSTHGTALKTAVTTLDADVLKTLLSQQAKEKRASALEQARLRAKRLRLPKKPNP